MAPHAPDGSSPYSEEEPHMNKLRRAIQLAVEDEIDNRDRNITRLEQEKLAYFAIEEFDIPITYSWYIAGAYPKVAGDPDAANSRSATTHRPDGHDPGEDEVVRSYRDFFTSTEFIPGYTLRGIWYTDRYDFLRDFYKECAPEEFRELYLISTDIREILRSIDDTIEREAANHSLSEWGSGSDSGILSEGDESDLRLLISDLHLEIGETDALAEILGPITRGTDVIEQVFAHLTTLSSISDEQVTVLNDLSEFFFYYVWRYPALYISAQTAEGPNADVLRADHANQFMDFQSDLLSKTKHTRNRCIEVGLYPDVGHHAEFVDGEVCGQTNEMMRDFVLER